MEGFQQQTMKLALAVMESSYDNREHNFNCIKDRIIQSAKRGIQMLVFPELSLTGYCPECADKTAINLDHAMVHSLCKLAGKYHMTVLVGCAEKTERKPYISQLVCNANGTLQCYRKTHLGKREQEFFRAGDTLPVFHGKIPFGVALCYDTHFPEVSTTLTLEGARLIVAPHASPSMAGLRKTVWDKYLPARAYDNRVYVACCNQCGTNGNGTVFSGGSVVYTPEGTILCEGYSETESILVAELSLSATERYRDRNDLQYKKFYLAHRRPELYRTERMEAVE